MRVCCIQPIRNSLNCLRIENLILLHLACTSCCSKGVEHIGRFGRSINRCLILLRDPYCSSRLKNLDIRGTDYLNIEQFTLHCSIFIRTLYAHIPIYFLNWVSVNLENGVGALNCKVLGQQDIAIFENSAGGDWTSHKILVGQKRSQNGVLLVCLVVSWCLVI